MRHSYSKVVGSSIYSISDKADLAVVKDINFDISDGKIRALLIPMISFFGRRELIVLPQDITNWSEDIFIQDSDGITEAADVVRLKDIYREHFSLVGIKVFTEAGSEIGSVIDYKICDVEMNLFSINIKMPFPDLSVLEINRNNIVSIQREKIVVENRTIKEEVETEEEVSCIPEPTYCSDKVLKQ